MIARLGVGMVFVGFAACASSGTGRSAAGPGTVSQWSGSFRSAGTASNAVLAPATPNRGTGTITFTSLGGTPAQMRVDLSVNVSAVSSTLGWAVYSGGCGSPGPMIGGPNQFPPISVSSSGDGHIRTELTLTLDPKGSYHANVYWTPRANDMNDVMMCANLQPGG